MINWILEKWLDWSIKRELDAIPLTHRAPKVQKERHEQWQLGAATATLMDDKEELDDRIRAIKANAVIKESRCKDRAEEAWLSQGSIDDRVLELEAKEKAKNE